MIIVEIYVHAGKENAYSASEAAGLTGEALNKAAYLGYEHKLSFEVDPKTGDGKLVAVDDRKLEVK